MKLFYMIFAIVGLSACAAGKVSDSKQPLMLETAINSDLLILKTDDKVSHHLPTSLKILLTVIQ